MQGGGQQGNHDDPEHHFLEIVADQRHTSEEIAQRDHERHPSNCAEHVEREKSHVMHPPDAGDKGREGSNDGYEFRVNNRFAAVPLVELVRPVKVFAPEQLGIPPLEEAVADFIAKQESGAVAE